MRLIKNKREYTYYRRVSSSVIDCIVYRSSTGKGHLLQVDRFSPLYRNKWIRTSWTESDMTNAYHFIPIACQEAEKLIEGIKEQYDSYPEDLTLLNF